MSADTNGSKPEKNKVEFIKQSESEILIRTYRENGEVVERTAIVMPPDQPERPAAKAASGSS
jgi:hypothetical protein